MDLMTLTVNIQRQALDEHRLNRQTSERRLTHFEQGMGHLNVG